MVAGFCHTEASWETGRESARAIKMLDLLTNRFYTGVVRGVAGMRLEIQMPSAARFVPGQRVRFALEEDGKIVARRDMQGAIVTHVEPAPGIGLHMNVMETEPVVAA